MLSDRPRAIRLLVLAGGVLCISTAAIFIRFAQREASSLVIAAGRMIVSTFPLLVYILLRRPGSLKQLRGKDLKMSVLSGVFLAFHFAAWISSLELTSITSSVVIVCTTPVWVTLADVALFKTKIAWRTIIGIGLTLLGGILIGASETCAISRAGVECQNVVITNNSRVMAGNLLALIGAWMAAGYLLIGRVVRQRVNLSTYALVVYGTAAILLSGTVLLAQLKFTGYSLYFYGFIILLAVFPQLIGHSTLNWALKYLPVTYVTIANMGEPIGSTIFAIILFKEIPTPLKVLGAIIILLGILTVTKTGLTAGNHSGV